MTAQAAQSRPHDPASGTEDLERFLYIISHDFKAAVRALTVVPTWLEEDIAEAGLDLPPSIREDLRLLKQGGVTLDKMLDGLTELSRIGRNQSPPETIDVAAVFQSVWSRIPRTNGFDFHLDTELGLVHVPLDLFTRLVHVLVENAVVHHDGSGTVRVRRITGSQGARFDIVDDGPGVQPKYADMVMQPFKTLKRRDETGRVGLGLTIARRICQKLGGELTLLPNGTAQGTCVRLDFPVTAYPLVSTSQA